MTALWIFIGGGIGSVARWWCSALVARHLDDRFPWGTLLVNVTGSFVIGLVATLTTPGGPWIVTPDARAFVMIGLCGGYTTFSAFSLQTFTLLRNGEWLLAGANATLSFLFCIIAVWLGHAAAMGIAPTKTN